MLDFRLRVFHTVATLLNFTKAAGVLHVTQPAVTKHIKELEQEYKVTLFDRQPNALALTYAGQLFYRHATTIMQQYQVLEFDMNAIHHPLTGQLRLGATATIAQYLLGPLLAAYHQRYPHVQVQVTSQPSVTLLQALQQKDIDMALVEDKADNSALHFTQYLEDEIVLVCSAQNKLFNKNEALLSDLPGLSFIVSDGDAGTHQAVSDHLKKSGIYIDKLKISMRLATIEGVKQFVEHSDHFAFLSIHALSRELSRSALRVINVRGLDIRRQFYIARHSSEPLPMAHSLISYITTHNNK